MELYDRKRTVTSMNALPDCEMIAGTHSTDLDLLVRKDQADAVFYADRFPPL